jgi:hypothetical protein
VLGSAFLGWHYAIDGYVSIAVVSMIWWTVGRILNRRAAGTQAAGTTTSAV